MKLIPWRLRYIIQPFISIRYAYICKGWYFDFRKCSLVQPFINFLIIGTMKAGTTSLFRYLGQHPDIFTPHMKEAGFFLDRNNFDKNTTLNLSRYKVLKILLHGYKGERLIGDASTYYTKMPVEGSEVPENVMKSYPKMKFIYVVRNPLDRIVSQYLQHIKIKRFDCSFDDYLNRENTYLSRGLYCYQLGHYLERFEKKQFLIILYEEFIKNTSATLKKVVEFLEADQDYSFTGLDTVYNKSAHRESYTKSDLKFSKEQYDRIIIPIKEDVSKFEKFLNRPLDLWDLSKEKWQRK